VATTTHTYLGNIWASSGKDTVTVSRGVAEETHTPGVGSPLQMSEVAAWSDSIKTWKEYFTSLARYTGPNSIPGDRISTTMPGDHRTHLHEHRGMEHEISFFLVVTVSN
jgi:hypothetical protein